MKSNLFDDLADVCCPDLTREEHVELAKFATDFRQAAKAQSSEDMGELIKEAFSDVTCDDEFDKLDAWCYYIEKYAAGFDLAKTRDMVMIGGAGAAALGALGRVLGKANDKRKHEAALRSSLSTIKSEHPHLFEASDVQNTGRYFDMLRTFAPSVAVKPAVAGNVLNRYHRLGPAAMDTNTIRELASTESSIGRESGTSLFQDVISDTHKGLGYFGKLKDEKGDNK